MYAPGPSWDLNALFPGGPTSSRFRAALDEKEAQLEALMKQLKALPTIREDPDGWRTTLSAWLDLSSELGDHWSLAYCHNSAHTEDVEGRAVVGRLGDLRGRLDAGEVIVDTALGAATDEDLATLASGSLESWHAAFVRTRRHQVLRLEPALEDLLAEADREALHGWGHLYSTVTGSLTCEIEEDGELQVRGVAQVMNARSSADPAARKAASEALDKAYAGIEVVCAASLNAITGTRQMRLDRVDAGPLDSSLLSNRIDQGVLDAMWEGIDASLPDLVRYHDAKAGLLRSLGQRDTDKLSSCDLSAPVGVNPGGPELSWSDAQELIVDAFASFEPDLAAFAKNLLAEGGVESEDRGNKRPGGYCAGFDAKQTSRIFMTYSGSLMEAVILAHELGHAWHNHILYRSPAGKRLLTMSLAESASTFAESIMRDRIDAMATEPSARLAILDQKLQAASAFLMNIRARFEFEKSLYTMRRQGPLAPAALSETMMACTKRAYCDSLADYGPYFWASKGHFYISEFGFYNWPYTFGYLFSGALYERAKLEGPSFRPQVVDLLQRTGWQDAVPLARETLGVDLRNPEFWATAAAPVKGLVDEFETLARA